MKIGIGYDVHRLQSGRKLILGGVDIPYEKGLEGHSDADVLVHSIIDAILGAMNEGDIGCLFPDKEATYKDISSIFLLEEVSMLLKSRKLKVGNIDSIIVAQKPKMREYIGDMRKNIADTLDVSIEDISVKATTTESLGFEGRMEGISAQAVVLLESVS